MVDAVIMAVSDSYHELLGQLKDQVFGLDRQLGDYRTTTLQLANTIHSINELAVYLDTNTLPTAKELKVYGITDDMQQLRYLDIPATIMSKWPELSVKLSQDDCGRTCITIQT